MLGLAADGYPEGNSQEEAYILIGEEMMNNFDLPLIKNIIRYHHCNLKSPNYPHELPENLRVLLNITAVCTRFDQLYYGNLAVQQSKAFSMLEEETRNELWPHEIILILKQLISSGNFIEQR